MRKLERGMPPDFLTEELQNQFGERYQINREKSGKKHKFNYWHKKKTGGKTIYQGILVALRNLSLDHCFYCDGYPPKRPDDTIDHFKPKLNPNFYKDVCRWNNLYYSCGHCQQSKMEQYNELIIRPDEINYNFSKYFDYDSDTDEILVNSKADEFSRLRAEETIKIFDFNHVGQKKSRKFFRIIREKDANHPIDDLAFRFLFD